MPNVNLSDRIPLEMCVWAGKSHGVGLISVTSSVKWFVIASLFSCFFWTSWPRNDGWMHKRHKGHIICLEMNLFYVLLHFVSQECQVSTPASCVAFWELSQLFFIWTQGRVLTPSHGCGKESSLAMPNVISLALNAIGAGPVCTL